MVPEGLENFVIDFVNKGIVSLVGQEVLNADVPVDPAEVEAAQRHVREEIRQFFKGLNTVKELEARIVNLPTRSYLKLSLRQHILFARLAMRKTEDEAVQDVEAPASDSTLAVEDQDRLLGPLALQFGLTGEEVKGILEMLSPKEDAQ